MAHQDVEKEKEIRLRGLDRALEICEDANFREEPILSAALLEDLEEVFHQFGVMLDDPLRPGVSPTEAHDRILDAQEAYRRVVSPSRRSSAA